MVHDLSKIHEPINPQPRVGRKVLTDDQAAAYDENGFLIGVDVLTSDEIETLRADLDEVVSGKWAGSPLFYEYNRNESDDPGKVLFHALGAWRVSPAFHDLVFHPILADAFERLLGGPVRFWHDQVFVKPAQDGGVVAWHQDYSYWTRTKPMAHATAWIGLDDSTEENGCVQYIPRSHFWDLLPRNVLAGNMEAVRELLSEEQRDEFRPVPSILKAGQASFHHPLTLHGSYENRSNRPRRGVAINVILDGVRSDSDKPLLEGVPPVGKGSKIEGRFFPLLSGTTA